MMYAAAVDFGFDFQVTVPFDEMLNKARVVVLRHRVGHHRKLGLVGKLWSVLRAAF